MKRKVKELQPTPITDFVVWFDDYGNGVVDASIARKLERDRAELLLALSGCTDIATYNAVVTSLELYGYDD